jgi:hypothetical protein
MSRGRLVLDGSTRALEEVLYDLNVIVLVPPPGSLNQHRRLYLCGRILVTIRADDFVDEATAHEYGVIEVPEQMLEDPVKAARTISRGIVKHGLWSLAHSFVFNLGSGRLRDLWAEEHGARRSST